MPSINRKRKGWSFCLRGTPWIEGQTSAACRPVGLSPQTAAHTTKVYSPHRCDIQEKAFRGAAATERQCKQLVASDVATLNTGSYDPARFTFTPRLTMYSLPSMGAMCGGSRSR